MKPLLRVLIVEDSEFDAQMIIGHVRKGGYEVVAERVETTEASWVPLTGYVASPFWRSE